MNNEQSHAGSDEPLVFEQKMEGNTYSSISDLHFSFYAIFAK
jgi:hypothetical protein